MTARRLQDVPYEFAGCARPCWSRELKHTYAWGSCAMAEESERTDPEFGWWRTITAQDGISSIVMASIPLQVILPWAKFLPIEERYQMMEELAESADPAMTLKQWHSSAMVWADPMTLDALTREFDPSGYVVAPLPCEDVDRLITTGEIAKNLGVSRPTAARLLDNGKIPFVRVSVTRKARLGDVLAYRDDHTHVATKEE